MDFLKRLTALFQRLEALRGKATQEEFDAVVTEANDLVRSSDMPGDYLEPLALFASSEGLLYDVKEPEVVTEKKEDEIDPEKDIDVPVPKLASHQIDIPEEPERVEVITQVWNAATGMFEEKNLGVLMLVPTGCEEPEFLSPYDNTVSFRSPLPRDKQVDANLHGALQKMGVVSREWIQEHTDEEIDPVLENRRIADDIPVLMALQGKQGDPTATGVAQTPGLEGKGDNNGAPLPPGPGPGRGNTAAPGDNGASQPAP